MLPNGFRAPRKWTWLDYYLAWSPTMRLIGILNPRFDISHLRPDDGDPSPDKPKREMKRENVHRRKRQIGATQQ